MKKEVSILLEVWQGRFGSEIMTGKVIAKSKERLKQMSDSRAGLWINSKVARFQTYYIKAQRTIAQQVLSLA